ncbi:hypothetical protein [Streptomyces botrytidirepellens]|nr:hypothetical protein [Streptomyces botrytidirepellens]
MPVSCRITTVPAPEAEGVPLWCAVVPDSSSVHSVDAKLDGY